MSQLMIFPWIDRQELRKVYKELYSDLVILQKHALGRIEVWASRAQHKLPVACECTGALVNANIEFQRAGPLAERDSNIVVLYSMALVRFVNHVTEKGQSKTYAVPVHRLAKEIGIPEWIVDVRHCVSHGNFPSIYVLRAAARWALNWLKTEFWEKQIPAPYCGPSQGQINETPLRDSLVIYQQQKFQEITDKCTKVDDDLYLELEKNVRNLGATTCTCLTEDGYLIPTQEQLDALSISATDILTADLSLHKGIFSFWRNIIRIMHRCDLIPSLVLHLVSMVTEDVSLRNKLLYSWLYTLIQCSSNGGGGMFKSNVLLPRKQLLEKCVQLRGPYVQDIIAILLNKIDNGQVSVEKQSQLQTLVSVFNTQTTGSTVTDTSLPVFSLQDIQSGPMQQNRWAVCEKQYDWSNSPIGRLPNQIIHYKTLELFEPDADIQIDDYDNDDEDTDEELTAEGEDETSMDIDSHPASPEAISTSQLTNRPWTNEAVKTISSKIQIF